MNKTLTQIQDEAIQKILLTRENGKRAAGYGASFLNRSYRGLRAARRGYEKAAAVLGFTVQQIDAQWSDIKDMALLEARAE